ncbi:DNA-binding domain-containing protein [Xanthobacter autotrophicus]|uniref:HvfC/BufC N-terminal domain-containing protein n=1 Tax=Xanthobacter TaxID=279 RepID=UPI0024AA786D|nr:DNA-binding domain-containing protein [Xanthobacter autotrophicus]MDI4665924.1 DNA-binding domain-containing protein [Xanthobacter autotrophicus]
MSPTLSETQRAFGAALLDPDAPVPAGVGGPGGRPDARRFAVYRNNVMVGLIDALSARFPVCACLVGTEFFRAMARIFVAANKPRSPLLMTYGDYFPDFIEGFEPAAAVPYLADVARLEVAFSQAFHAAEAVALDAAALGPLSAERLAGLQLVVHPSVRLVRSAYPVASIWMAHQQDGAIEGPDDWCPEDVLVIRPAAEVLIHRLPQGGFAFLGRLRDGGSVIEAAAAGYHDAPDFDLGGTLLALFTLGAVVGVLDAPFVETGS